MRRDCDDAQIKDLEERIEVSANQEVSMLERLNEYVLFPCPPFSFFFLRLTKLPLPSCVTQPHRIPRISPLFQAATRAADPDARV
jgi:hypothetical protein